jgi:membrane-associated HD superfamily phosphohydrolase
VVTGAALSALLTIQLLPDKVSLRVQQTAPEDVIAYRYVRYLDERATQELRAEAEASVPKQYANDQNAPAEAEREARRFFEAVRRAKGGSAAWGADGRRDLTKELGKAFSPQLMASALTLDARTLAQLERRAVAMVREAMAQPIPDDTDDLSRIRRRLGERMSAFSLPGGASHLAREVASVSLRPNRIFEAQATAEARRREADAVTPIYRVVRRGDVIIRRDDRVTPEHLEALNALGLRSPHIDLQTAVCLSLIGYGLVALVGVYLYHFQRRLYQDVSRLLLLALIAILCLLIFRVAATTLGLKLSGAQLGYLGMMR